MKLHKGDKIVVLSGKYGFGAGYELETNARWSSLTIVISVLLTIAFWAFVLLR